MLLSLECVTDGFNAANLIIIIMQAIYISGGILDFEINFQENIFWC
jgi:hypothetical protein